MTIFEALLVSAALAHIDTMLARQAREERLYVATSAETREARVIEDFMCFALARRDMLADLN